MTDQAASLFGSGCLKPGDLKITMGTGTFVNVNTGREPHASITGKLTLHIHCELIFFNVCCSLEYVVNSSKK